ncbi:DtxR family transcriptional regulator, Mn-dependent transcriptional regulator [Candidatus Magnetomoraceae bacterium gMMP-15]
MTGLSESLEDYLEIILDLEKKNKVARAKDIADKMGVKRGSVTGALKSLGEKGLINYEPYSYITLTQKGAKIAKEITRRHTIFKDFLFNVVQIDADKADAIACRMEHTVDKSSIDKLLKFINFIYKCPRSGEDWLESFVNYCANQDKDWETCKKCIKKCNTRHNQKKN